MFMRSAMRIPVKTMIWALLLVALTTACSKGPGSSPEATVIAYLEARKANDNGGMLKCYVLSEQELIKKGSIENMEKSLGDLLSYDVNIDEKISGDDAVCTVLTRFKKDGGREMRVKLYFVLKRGADGWKIAQLETARRRMSANDMIVDK